MDHQASMVNKSIEECLDNHIKIPIFFQVFRERKVTQVFQVVMVVLVYQVLKVIVVLMDIQVY
jgi:hypothetical protein